MAKAAVQFEVKGEDRLNAVLKFKGKAAVHQVDKGLMMAALILHGDIVKSIQKGSRTGKKYPRPGGKVHVASAPGEAPKADSGNLATNIIPDVRRDGNRSEVVVVSRAKYSRALEFGTRDGRLEARPFMHPAYERNKKRILQLAAKGLKRGTNA